VAHRKRLEADEWKRGLLDTLSDGSDAVARGRLSPADAVRVSEALKTSPAFRLNFIDTDGHVFWSTEGAGRIGRPVEAADLAKLAKGRPHAIVERHRGNGPARAAVVAEVYTPVSNDGRFAGAIEFYTDVTPIFASTARLLRLALGIITLAGGMVMISGLWLLFRANVRRVRILRERAERDAEAMAEQVRIAREVQLLGELNEWMHSASTLDDLFRMVSRYMAHLMPVSEGAIYVYSPSRDVLDGWAAWNGAPLHGHIHPDECWALRRGRTYAYGTGEISFACEHVETATPRPYFCFPILAHGETVGLMHIRAGPGEPAPAFRAGRKLAQICAEQIAMAIANVQMRDQLREQATRDALTGLFNRRHMLDRLRMLTARAGATDAGLTVAMIDIDHFKRFNDNHGHDAGDMVLRAVAARIGAAASGDDALACRYGGEEFALVLPGMNAAEAGAHLDRLRAAVAGERIVHAGGKLPAVTISAGVAEFPAQGTLLQEVLRAADEALYRAKAEGRDRVVLAGERPAPEGGTRARRSPPAAGDDAPPARAARLSTTPTHAAG